MTSAALETTTLRRLPARGIVSAGLAGGAVDFLYASGSAVARGHAPLRVWQAVAQAWLGEAAMSSGWPAATLGLLTHFTIAIGMAFGYAIVLARFPQLNRRPWVSGAVYGLVLYAAMNFVVVPLRWWGQFPTWSGLRTIGDVVAHVAVGLVIALVLSRTASRQPAVSGLHPA